jgi:hypothetical protein
MMQFRFPLGPVALEPFPHAEYEQVFDAGDYLDLVRRWPHESTFKTLAGPYTKLSLSERCHPKAYGAFLIASAPWRAVYKYVKSPAFIARVFAALASWGLVVPDAAYAARFEFSSLPAEGGRIEPHRDIPSKLVTIVVPMTLDAVPGWGTDILAPLGAVGDDYQTPRDAFRTVTSFAYAPNTCGIFVKTADSWHAIGPLKGPAGQYRRSITINVESV